MRKVTYEEYWEAHDVLYRASFVSVRLREDWGDTEVVTPNMVSALQDACMHLSAESPHAKYARKLVAGALDHAVGDSVSALESELVGLRERIIPVFTKVAENNEHQLQKVLRCSIDDFICDLRDRAGKGDTVQMGIWHRIFAEMGAIPTKSGSGEEGMDGDAHTWSAPDGYVGTKTVCHSPDYQKEGHNPPRTTLQDWINADNPKTVTDPQTNETYLKVDWVRPRLRRWSRRQPNRRP